MGNINLLGLVFVYGIITMMMIMYTMYKIKYEYRLTCITMARAMWILIFGIVPLCVHCYVYNNGQNIKSLMVFDFSDKGILQFYFAALFSIIGFIGLNIGYNVTLGLRNKPQYVLSQNDGDKNTYTDYSDSVLLISAFIMFAIGLCSLILWTRAFGGVVAFLDYASAVRSGYDTGITNSYTVFKRFAPLLQFANLIYFAIWKKEKKPLCLILFILSLFFSILYLLANDGRAPMIMHFVSLAWLWSSFSHRKNSKKTRWILIVLCGFAALLLMHNYESIYGYLKNGTDIELSGDIFSSIRDEFSFTTRNIQAVFLALEDNPYMFKLPSELLNGLFGILPSGLRPDWLVNLEKVNTQYWVMGASAVYYGGKPPDIITTGIYTMNYFGILLLPMVFGMILKKLDDYFKKANNAFSKILFASLLYPVIRTVAYTNFNGLTLNVFYIVLACLIIYFVDKLVKSKRSIYR